MKTKSHIKKYHTAIVIMAGIPDFNGIPFRSFKKAKEYAAEVNSRSRLPMGKAVKIR